MDDNKHTYALRIDGPLLRRQRQCLLTLRNAAAKDNQGLLEGVISLLDELSDQAHDLHGIDCLLDSAS